MDRTGCASAQVHGCGPEPPQSALLFQVEPGCQEGLQLEAEPAQGWQGEQEEQETAPGREEPPVQTALPFSEESITDPNQENTLFKLKNWNEKMDLQRWMEKINNIIQKINVTESTVKSLLNEVISLEGQIERLESHQDLESDQVANIEAEACKEAHELQEKLIERMENFCKDVTLVNTEMGKDQMQEGKTDSHSPGEMGIGETQPLLPQSPPPPGVENSAHVMVWRRALRISVLFCVLTFTGLSCYVLFFDPTFIFETMLPGLLGRQAVWELREIIVPFLNLEAEDLLPS
ncbi:single-pass membrane and coiled-coil domain-containing protein 2 [Dasypus novemcinctus]|uniref:single-pass membrane and coiled-coil domain-containing protein 2 n=1 Tax=Dasypus novemcinctus TaxID=9361 RepID=UPI00265E3287|nr:single-pass membrane and coiled-coil domain-containing protein 2 [Dasypus novemcinctus]